MIKFETSDSMLHPDKVFLTCFVEGRKQPTRELVRKTELENKKLYTVRHILITELTNLCTQRENTYAHASTFRENAIKAIAVIKHALTKAQSQYNSRQFFETLCNTKSYFEMISPSENSRYKNWRPAMELTFQFCEKCLQHYTQAEIIRNQQIVDTQRVNQLNTMPPALSGI